MQLLPTSTPRLLGEGLHQNIISNVSNCLGSNTVEFCVNQLSVTVVPDLHIREKKNQEMFMSPKRSRRAQKSLLVLKFQAA